MHSWRMTQSVPLETRSLPVLLPSASDATLRPSKRRLPKVAASARATPAGVSSALVGGLSMNAQSSAEIEVRLNEVLATCSACPPSRQRSQAVLDALRDLSDVQSPFGTLLKTLETELRASTISAGEQPPSDQRSFGSRDAVLSASPARTAISSVLGNQFYFEVVQRLEEEVGEWKLEVNKVETRNAKRNAQRVELEAALESTQKKLDEALKAIDKAKRREAERDRRAGLGEKELHMVMEERDVLLGKVAKLEETLRMKADAFKDAQVELFIEKKRAHEATSQYKEERAEKKEAEKKALEDIKRYQVHLLRAHHRVTKLTQETTSQLRDLAALSLGEQVAAAKRWCSELEAVAAEADLFPDERPDLSKQTSQRFKAATNAILLPNAPSPTPAATAWDALLKQ